MTADTATLAQTVREGLVDGHEYSCGCDRPGDPQTCIHADRFAALAALKERATQAEARLAVGAKLGQVIQYKERTLAAEAKNVRLETALRGMEGDGVTTWLQCAQIARAALADAGNEQ